MASGREFGVSRAKAMKAAQKHAEIYNATIAVLPRRKK